MSSYWSKRQKIQQEVDQDLFDLALDQDQFHLALGSFEREEERQEVLAGGLDFTAECDGVQSSGGDCAQEEEDRVEEGEDHVEEGEDHTEEEEGSVEEEEESNNVPHSTLGQFLGLLGPIVPGLPADPRTLLWTTRKSRTKPVSGGLYFHSGMKEGVLNQLATSQDLGVLQQIVLQINIDGLPIQKSSNAQFWPILGLIGKTSRWDPDKQNAFCNWNFLWEEGIQFNGKHLSVTISAIVCDAPAPAFVRNTKGHSGFHYCHKCQVRGVRYMGRVVFLETTAPPRSDQDKFSEDQEEVHYHGDTPLSSLSVGLVSQFPLD